MTALKGARIAVAGGASADAPTLALARALGERLGRAGAIVYTGGRGGVMEAVCRGARDAGGLTVGILPGTDPGDANPFVEVTVCTGMGHGRNAIVVTSGDLLIALPGGAGTLSEIALALALGRPVISLRSFDLPGVPSTGSVDQALHLALTLLRTSSR